MSDDLVKEVIKDCKRLAVYVDDTPQDPREWDNLGTMVCYHKRYDIGDDMHKNEDPFEFEEWVTTSEDVALYLPIYMLDHSGITIRVYPFGDPWDSGQLGYIYVTKERLRKEYGVEEITPELLKKVREILKEEVREEDFYLRGDVYGFVLEECYEVKDSLWGCYGYDNLKEFLLNNLSEEYHQLVDELNL